MNVTVTYLEGREDWMAGEWVAQPEGDEYALCISCDMADVDVSAELGSSVADASKVLSACFGEDWRSTKDDSPESVGISAWTCVIRDRGTIDSVLRTSKRVARMVRKYIPEVRYVHAKNLERDVQLVDWSECDGKFVNTIRMSVVAADSSVRYVQDMCASSRAVTLRLGLWCVVGRNDSCEVFWNLHSVEVDDVPDVDPAESDVAVQTTTSEPPAGEDELRRLRRAMDRARAKLPSLEVDSDSDADESERATATARAAELRAAMCEADDELGKGPEPPSRDWAIEITSRLKGLMHKGAAP